jgi:hypothetical protein
VQAIGNTVVTCDEAIDPKCTTARALGSGVGLDHNDYAMKYVNSAGGTFDSSSAQLTLQGTVAHAFLVWGGDSDQTPLPPTPAARNQVSFTTPAGTTKVTADRLADNGTGKYSAYADVTKLVSADGTYSVADLQTGLGQASFGGWSLVVVVHNPALPQRLLVAVAPLVSVTGQSVAAVTVPTLAPLSAATGHLVAVGFEGDYSLTGDRIDLSGFVVENPYKGAIGGTRSPNDPNNFGTDVLDVAATGMNGAQLVLKPSTTNDRVIFAMAAISLDL